jgi:hypothetical protein
MRRCLLLCATLIAPLGAQTVIRETNIQAPGGAAVTNGTITITPTVPFVAADGVRVEMQSSTFNIVGGAVTIPLEPNDTASPANTGYNAVYLLNGAIRRTEMWVVPTSSTPLRISSVAQSVTPPSTAAVQWGQMNAAGLADGAYCVTVVSQRVSLLPCAGGGSSSLKLSTLTNAQLVALSNSQLTSLSN